MRRTISMLVLASVCALVFPPRGHAQSASAIAGWIGLTATPVGGFTPVVPVTDPQGDPRGIGLQARWGHWQFAPDDDNTTNLGIGVVMPRGGSSTTLEVGRSTKKDCDDCDAILVGLDVHAPLWESRGRSGWGEETFLGVGINPAAGYHNASDSDFSALSAAASVPLWLSVRLGEGARIAPFFSPGVGLGRVSGGDESESGARAMVAGGVAVGNHRVQVTGSFRKVFIDEGATVYGIGLSVHR